MGLIVNVQNRHDAGHPHPGLARWVSSVANWVAKSAANSNSSGNFNPNRIFDRMAWLGIGWVILVILCSTSLLGG